MQTNLEQIYNDYINLKNYIEEDSKKTEEQKKSIREEALKLETIEEQSGLYFDKIGYKELLKIDLLEKKKELYYFYLAYKDLIEVAENIKEELLDYKAGTVFAVKDGKKELINKELYNFYKKQSQDYSVEIQNRILSQNQED